MPETTEKNRNATEGAAYRWALRASAVSLGVLAIAGAVVAGALRGGAGVRGALAGVGLAAIAALVTQGAMVMGYRRAPHVFASIVGGSWLAKMVVIVVGMLVLSRVDGVDRPSFGVVALFGIVMTLGIDVVAVRKARIPYVISSSDSEDS